MRTIKKQFNRINVLNWFQNENDKLYMRAMKMINRRGGILKELESNQFITGKMKKFNTKIKLQWK